MDDTPGKRLRKAFLPEDGKKLLESVKAWVRTEWRPEQRMFEGIALAMLREESDDIVLMEIHKVRQYMNFMPSYLVTQSRIAANPDGYWYMGIRWGPEERKDAE